MKKVLIILVLALFIVSIFPTNIFAQGDSVSGEDFDPNRDLRKKVLVRTTTINDEGREVEIRTRTDTRNRKIDERRTFLDEDGNKVTIRTRTRDGRVTKSIRVKGAKVNTRLEIREDVREGKTRLRVKLSTGTEKDIKSPDDALEIALEKLGAVSSEFEFDLEEFDGRAVFIAKSKQKGRIFGIFKTVIEQAIAFDAETGEPLEIEGRTKRGPWWKWTLTGRNKVTICHNTEDSDNPQTITVGPRAVRAHVANHEDTIGPCEERELICGDDIIVDPEVCDGNSQACTTASGEAGIEPCNAACDGFDTCVLENICGNNILDEGETCDGSSQECTTAEGYSGTEACNLTCDGFDPCITEESCGDGIVNGSEECDDGNEVDGDGCDSLCKSETTTPTS